MRGLRGLGLVVLMTMGVGLLPTTAASAAGCKRHIRIESTASTCKGELGWSYDPAARTFRFGSVIASAKAGDPYEYNEDYACEANTTRPGTGIGCRKAFDCPPRVDSEGKSMSATRVMALRKLKANPDDPWQATNTGVCQYTGKAVPMSTLMDARQELTKKVGKASIIAQPPGGVTLVNFVSLFHAPHKDVTTLEITKPVSGTITATPRYTWELDDEITAEGEGHAYDREVDPKSPDSDGYYVKANYRSPGAKTVTLTLTWNVTITLNGHGAIPLEPIVLTATTTTTAKTAHARLVR